MKDRAVYERISDNLRALGWIDMPVDSFQRKITSVIPNDDGSAEVTYECGHSATWVIPPQGIAEIACAECVNACWRSIVPDSEWWARVAAERVIVCVEGRET